MPISKEKAKWITKIHFIPDICLVYSMDITLDNVFLLFLIIISTIWYFNVYMYPVLFSRKIDPAFTRQY